MCADRIQVAIFSQQAFLRQGIEHSLRSISAIDAWGVAAVDDDIMSTMDRLLPDVAIVDIDGSPENGLALARRLKQRLPSIGIIVLTSSPSDGLLFQALKAQAAAYHSKEVTPEVLVETVRRVASGEHPINEGLLSRPEIADQVLQQFQELSRRAGDNLISPLTVRETEILNYIAQGLLNKQIAVTLGISEQTIKNHVTSILRKLNANARTEAVVVAIRQGLISVM